MIAVFDQDLPIDVVLKFPKLYIASQRDSDLNLRIFAQTIANAVVHALVCFWVCYLCYNKNHSLFLCGTLFYSALLTTMKLKVISLTLTWTKYHVWLLAFSMGLFFFFLAVYPNMTFLSYDMFGVPAMMVQEPLYWHLFFMTPIAALLTDFTLTTVQQQLFPKCEDILREKFAGYGSGHGNGSGGGGGDAILPDAGISLGETTQSATASAAAAPVRPHTAIVLPQQSISRTASNHMAAGVDNDDSTSSV